MSYLTIGRCLKVCEVCIRLGGRKLRLFLASAFMVKWEYRLSAERQEEGDLRKLRKS